MMMMPFIYVLPYAPAFMSSMQESGYPLWFHAFGLAPKNNNESRYDDKYKTFNAQMKVRLHK